MIGELPGYLSEEQRLQLESQIGTVSGTILPRLLRDVLLYSVDSDSYHYSRSLAEFVYSDDEQLLDYLYLLENSADKYIRLLDRVAAATVEISDEPTTDLLLPCRLSTDYSLDSMSRVQSVVSVLTSIHKSISKGSAKKFSPYEGLATLRSMTRISRLYSLNYMGEYTMMLKVDENADYGTATILHEYLVGIVMNSLRDTIANFIYTYGYVDDVHIYRSRNSAYCLRRDNGQYALIQQYIQRSVPMTELEIGTAAFSVVRNSYSIVDEQPVLCEGVNVLRLILIQLLSALAYSYYILGFVHRDLNPSNVLIVQLPTIMAVPLMIPTMKDDTVHFELQYMITNALVVVVDLEVSTVRADVLSKYGYPYQYLISTESAFVIHEKMTAFENDIVRFLTTIKGTVERLSYDEKEEISRDILSILYRLYTGQSLDGDVDAWTEYSLFSSNVHLFNTHPSIKYDHYGAVSEYCSRYSSLFLTKKKGIYASVLDSTHGECSVDTEGLDVVIDSAQRYYWYDRFYEELGNLPVDTSKIEENEWYRSVMIAPLLSSAVYDNTELSNELVYEEMTRENGAEVTLRTALLLYRYTNHFEDFRLSILPLRYDEPEDLLEDLDTVGVDFGDILDTVGRILQ